MACTVSLTPSPAAVCWCAIHPMHTPYCTAAVHSSKLSSYCSQTPPLLLLLLLPENNKVEHQSCCSQAQLPLLLLLLSLQQTTRGSTLVPMALLIV